MRNMDDDQFNADLLRWYGAAAGIGLVPFLRYPQPIRHANPHLAAPPPTLIDSRATTFVTPTSKGHRSTLPTTLGAWGIRVARGEYGIMPTSWRLSAGRLLRDRGHRGKGTAPVKRLTATLLVVLGACVTDEVVLEPEAEPEPQVADIAYAALPLTLTPDSMTIPVGTGIDLQHVEYVDSGRISQHLIEVSNSVPILRRCAVGQAYARLRPRRRDTGGGAPRRPPLLQRAGNRVRGGTAPRQPPRGDARRCGPSKLLGPLAPCQQ